MVKELYETRDGLFSVDPTERMRTLKERQRGCLDLLATLAPARDGSRARALQMYAHGKALDVTEEHVPDAEVPAASIS